MAAQEKLKITLFGRFGMSWIDANGVETPVALTYAATTKLMQLLISILTGGRTGIRRQVLLERFYETEFVEDPTGTLRVNIHRLRKYLKTIKGLEDKECICTKGGLYFWNREEVDLVLDTEVFEQLLEVRRPEETEEAKTQRLLRAAELYKGEFLAELAGEEWAAASGANYQQAYFTCLRQLRDLLESQENYEKLLEISRHACKIYPYEEYYLNCIDSLLHLGRFQEAAEVYEEATDFYFEELGLTPSEEMLKRFQEMGNKVRFNGALLDEIKDALVEPKHLRGAYYCAYPGFTDCFHVICRMQERNGQAAFLMLITLQDKNGLPIADQMKADKFMEILKDSIGGSLRRGDTFTRYGSSQFLILLTGLRKEDCVIIQKRIESHFYGNVSRTKAILEFRAQTASENDLEGEKLSFRRYPGGWDQQ